MHLGTMLGREGHVGAHVGFGLVQIRRELGQLGPQLVVDASPLGSGCFGVVLVEGGGDEGGNDTAALPAGIRQHIAHEMYTAGLPSGVEHPGDRGLEAFMRIRDHELDAAQSTAGKLTQEGSAERLGLRGADIEPENLAPAIAIDPDGHYYSNRDDAAPLAQLNVGRVDPEVGPGLNKIVGALASGFAKPSYTTAWDTTRLFPAKR